MHNHEDRSMSTDQLPFAHALEQQRLEASLRESEMLREFSALLASSLDIEHILYVLVRRTTQVCDVERCAVWLFEEMHNLLRPKTYHLEAKLLDHRMVEAADRIWYQTPLSMEDPVIHQLFSEQGLLYSKDLCAVPTLRSVAETFLVRSVLLVGLIREGRPVGMLSLDDPGKIRTFTPEQIQLACAVGQQAAIAIDNARLYQQAKADRRRAEQLIDRMRSIYQVASTVNASEEVAPAFTVAIEHLVRGLEADGGMITLLDAGKLHRISSTGVEVGSEIQTAPVPLEQMPNCLQATTNGIPAFITEDQAKAGEITWFRGAGFQDVMIIPLLVRAHPPGRVEDGAAGQSLATKPPEFHEGSLPDRCVGLAFVNFRHPHTMPTSGQFAYAQDIAAQCALAAEKYRLLTEARKAAEVANERANTLDAVFHAMTEGITVSDMEGNVLVLNNAASHFLGVPKNFRNHLGSFLRRYPTYTIEGQIISEQNFPLTRALKGERIRAERFVTRRADGEERILEINIAPMRDIQGRQVGVVSAFRDVTEAIRAEQRIRQALDTLLHVAEAVSGIIDIRTILRSVLERTLITLNCARGAVYMLDESQEKFSPLLVIGFTSESEQRWVDELATWLDPTSNKYHSFFHQLLAGHAALINGEQYPSQPNPLEHLNILAAPIKHNKRVHGLLLLDRSPNYRSENEQTAQEVHEHNEFGTWDITVLDGIAELAGLAVEQAHWQHEAIDARTSEEDMRRANELKDEFMAITAHEFRTPLTIILAQTQLVGRSFASLSGQVADRVKLERAIKNLAVVEEQTRQLTDIVKTFLEVSQINRGQLTLNLTEVDLSEIIRQVVEQHSTHSEHHLIRCDIEPGQHSWIVKGDRARLQQIITNLVENAIKYSPLGGPVTVCLRSCRNGKEGKNMIEVCVEDRGIGIPPEFQTHLFERFYRAPSSVESRTKGIGLGLYIVAQLIQKLEGTIRVESSGVFGEGSRFIFTLPALESSYQA